MRYPISHGSVSYRPWISHHEISYSHIISQALRVTSLVSEHPFLYENLYKNYLFLTIWGNCQVYGQSYCHYPMSFSRQNNWDRTSKLLTLTLASSTNLLHPKGNLAQLYFQTFNPSFLLPILLLLKKMGTFP